MSAEPDLAGRVIVVAGEGPDVDAAIAELLAAEALVAAVGRDVAGGSAQVWFRVDPTDTDAWGRIIPHVEQRLGPIDGAVAGAGLTDLVGALLRADFTRRGHGRVVDVAASPDAAHLLRSLADTL